MMSNPIYIGYYFSVSPLQPASEILIAELGYLGFDSFVETDVGVNAFIQKKEWNADILKNIHVLESGEFDITYTFDEIEQVNWNEKWEKSFDPILVDDVCCVRAPFHEVPNVEYDIVIEPKMSFGTGHHETTYMMLQGLLKIDLQNKKVLDMGCGTGVLAILAKMKGASQVDAIDIDNWCYINTKENIKRNHCDNIKVYEGDSSLLKDKKYDVIIANINRNILINDMHCYVESLSPNGLLFLSGFYQEDLDIVTKKCRSYKLILKEKRVKNNWISAVYEFF